MFLRSLEYSVVHSENGNTLQGVELTWQPPNVIFSSFSTRIGIPGSIDIVVVSGQIFSTCFFLQCRNIEPKLTFCIFSLFFTQIVTSNTEQFQYI